MRSVAFLMLAVAPSAWAIPPSVITDVCDPSVAGSSDKDLCMCVADAVRVRSDQTDPNVPAYDYYENWWEGFTVSYGNGTPWGSMGAVTSTPDGYGGVDYHQYGSCFDLAALLNAPVSLSLRNEYTVFLANFAKDAAWSEGAWFDADLVCTWTDPDPREDRATNIVFDDVVDIGDFGSDFERAFCWMSDPDHCEIYGDVSGYSGTITTNGAQIQGIYLSDRNSDGLPDATVFLADGQNLILTTAMPGSDWSL